MDIKGVLPCGYLGKVVHDQKCVAVFNFTEIYIKALLWLRTNALKHIKCVKVCGLPNKSFYMI